MAPSLRETELGSKERDLEPDWILVGFEREAFSAPRGQPAWAAALASPSVALAGSCLPFLGKLSLCPGCSPACVGKTRVCTCLPEWPRGWPLGPWGPVPSPGHMLLTHQNKNVVILGASF